MSIGLIYIIGGIIKKLSMDQRKFHISKCLKLEKKRHKYNDMLRRTQKNILLGKKKKRVVNKNQYRADIPEVFSFERNFENTTNFFNKVIFDMRKSIRNRKYYFNFKDVKEISVDALMYLIALIYNLKGVSYLNYKYYGNKSKVASVNSLLVSSGFNQYVNSGQKKFYYGDSVKILNGGDVNTEKADNICDVVDSVLRSKSITDELYNLFIELMGNTVEHAYDCESVLSRSWYLYTEETDSYFKFVFLDTGLGIPRTINKKFLEKKMKVFLSDAGAICSALRGENRSKTQERGRGTGLPFVKEFGQLPYVDDFIIHSGSGICIIGENIEDNCKNKTSILNGTLFSWKICKKGDQYVY